MFDERLTRMATADGMRGRQARDACARGEMSSVTRRLARTLHNLNPLAMAARPGKPGPNNTAPAWRARPTDMPPALWRLARFLSFCGNPFVISIPCFAATSIRSSRRWSDRLRWWGIAAAVMTLPSFMHVRYGVRTGRFSDPEISVRQERFWPYLGEVAAVLTSYGIMRVLRAPREMTALVVSVAGAMVVITGVTLVWKMSMHVVGTAGAVTVLVLLYGRRMLPLLILVPLVGWSRYVLEHHTPAQVIGGGVVGVAAPLIVFRAMGLPSEPSK
jgi:membrane-associated phospholipid phosphatase